MQTLQDSQGKAATAVSSLGKIAADKVVSELEKHILVDGFKIVIDLEKSLGSRLVDAPTGRSFFGNHVADQSFGLFFASGDIFGALGFGQ